MAETDRLEIAIKAVNEASKALREVQKDLAGVESAGKKGSGGLQQFGQALHGGIQTIAKASAALVGFGIAMDQIFELGKAGAQIEFTKQKFDRLAGSIGTTGDALEKDLSRATKGMLSDFQLLESASNLMALGLVKDHDAAVRLTRVASAMNMNMNQLVLTLTNMTTMRFDALGVSVDGFKEKVKALEKQGRSAEEAFREAFLQQAEAQLEKVGDVADTTVGKFARMEAAVANLGDTFKEELAPFIGQAADAITTLLSWGDRLDTTFNEHLAEMIVLLQEGKVTQEEFDTEMLRAAEVVGKTQAVGSIYAGTLSQELNPATQEQVRLAVASANSYTDLGVRMLEAQRAADELAAAERDLFTATDALAVGTNRYSSELLFAKASAELDASAALQLGLALGVVDEKTIIATQAVAGLREKYDSNRDGAISAAEAAGGYTQAVLSLSAAINAIPDRTVHIDFDVAPMPSIPAPGARPVPLQHGGAFAAGAPIALHPPEIVMTPTASGFVVSQSDMRDLIGSLKQIAAQFGSGPSVDVTVGTGLLDQAIEVALGKHARAAGRTGIGRAIT